MAQQDNVPYGGVPGSGGPQPSAYELRLQAPRSGTRTVAFNTSSSNKFLISYEGSGANQKYFIEEYSPDGKRLVSRTQTTAEYAKQLVTKEGPRTATTPVERLTQDQLRSIISDIENIKPNAQGRYVYQGETYTEGALDKILKPYKDRLTQLEGISRTAGEQGARPDPGIDNEIKRVNQIRIELSQKIRDLKDEQRTVETAGEQNNLRSWTTYYETKLAELTGYVDALSSQNVKVGSVDTTFKNVSIEQATSTSPAGGATSQAGVVYGGVPGAGQGMSATGVIGTGLAAGQRGEQGILQNFGRETEPVVPADETPTVVDETPVSETPGRITTPEVVTGTTPGQSYTEPSTGVTYQPGQQIGGEDRALPNGGAVVNGTYIPPGIDYTWLSQQVPDDWKTAAKELYGAYYDMIKNDPQISDLLERAIKNEYSDAQFQVELEKTNWWRETTANARQFEILEATDPATARAQLDNRIALVRETAQRLGVTLSTESLEGLARNAINLGFDMTAQIEDIVGSEAIRTAGGVSQLRYGYVGNSIRESARKYGVSLSDVTFNEWVNKIAVGSESQQTFESYAQQIARTLYPSLNNGFDRGLSFAEMTDPYAQVASRILEIPGAQVDFTNPKWAAAFTMKDTKGEQMQMSFGEWADYLRTDPSFGWEYTDDAKNRAYTVVNRLGELFGAA